MKKEVEKAEREQKEAADKQKKPMMRTKLRKNCCKRNS